MSWRWQFLLDVLYPMPGFTLIVGIAAMVGLFVMVHAEISAAALEWGFLLLAATLVLSLYGMWGAWYAYGLSGAGVQIASIAFLWLVNGLAIWTGLPKRVVGNSGGAGLWIGGYFVALAVLIFVIAKREPLA